ncbi:cuticle protein 67 [Orussus abietinus]|uniref:cuticle protein 67 n=1 Tax=Orussus abietinus TaxID=222816 RepID=UPI000C715DA1|nr:cuticle protein 67 [Orussus abietinus]
MFKVAILACVLAVSQAGFLGAPAVQYAAPVHYAAPAALTSTSDNILRSHGNLAQVATQSKTIATPFSSSSKSDIRVSNPAIYAHAAPLAYAAPAVASAPIYAKAAIPAPVSYGAPVAHGASLLGVAYSPAVAVSHMTYSSPVGISYSW